MVVIVDDLDWSQMGLPLQGKIKNGRCWIQPPYVFSYSYGTMITHSVDPSVRKNKAAWTLSDTAIIEIIESIDC